MLETVYVVRHGFRMSTQAFARPSPTGTLRDPPLTAHGGAQVRLLAKHMQDKDIAAIFSSPFYRCLQTATPVAEALGLPIFVEPGISEWYGRVIPGTGLHPRPPPAASLSSHFPLIDAASHTPLLYPPRTGETLSELHDRTLAALALLFDLVERTMPEARAILLVTHAATNIALGRALTGDRELIVSSPTCGLSRYDRTTKGSEPREGETARRVGRWTCAYHGDCSFLPEGAERDWAFEHIVEMEEEGVCPFEDESIDTETEGQRPKL